MPASSENTQVQTCQTQSRNIDVGLGSASPNLPAKMDISKTIKAIIILGYEGKRAIAKHFDPTISADADRFEAKIYARTKSQKIREDVILMDNFIIVHRFIKEMHIYVVGARNENPLILDKVLNCLVEVMSTLFNRKQIDDSVSMPSANFYGSLELMILAMDEICEQGVILETDPNLVLERVCLESDVAEHSMASVIQNATENFRFRWVRG